MPIWNVVDNEIAYLMSWQAFRVHTEGLDDTVHVAGYRMMLGEGRVSSPLQGIDLSDPKVPKVLTRSGRIYLLDNYSTGINLTTEYVWTRWRGVNNIASYENVTADLLAGKLDIPQIDIMLPERDVAPKHIPLSDMDLDF